MQIAYVVIVD